jgi:capsular polysaccharide biosynthesis protein
LGAALAFFALMFTAPYYKSSTDFLVVQVNAGNQDFYTQFKSSEYLGKVLGEAVYSESFINAVIETGKVSSDALPFDKKERLQTWKDTVHVKKNLELGVIQIEVDGNQEKEVTSLMEGISKVLIERNTLFRGGDPNSVQIRVLSGPITERTPALALVVKTVIAGFAAGFLLTLLAIFLRKTKKSKIENMLNL